MLVSKFNTLLSMDTSNSYRNWMVDELTLLTVFVLVMMSCWFFSSEHAAFTRPLNTLHTLHL